ncbi:MAG TPA: CpaF family protein [Gaiellaceae bacterium]
MGLHDRLTRQGEGRAPLTVVADGPRPAPQPAQPPAAEDPYAELKARIHHQCIAKLGPELFKQDATESDIADQVYRAVTEELALDRTPLTREERREIVRQLTDDILGYGPIEPLLRDDSITEVMVNGADKVYVERNGKLERTEIRFVDDSHVMRIIDKIVSQIGRRVDEASPMVDARLPDGSRVNAIIPPLALNGPTVTIRKFARDPYTVNDLISFGTLTARSAQFLAACVKGKLNILISGGTGTGKTTTLNAMSAFIPGDERIVTIEDAAELQLQQEHVITLESRPSNIEGSGEVKIRELVRNALRMRPDRIIVGEVRGAETVDMLQAMNTGHEGSLTTIHANSPRDALSRLETLVLTAGAELPHRAIREQIASAFDLLVQIQRLVDGSRRITHVSEVLGMEADVVTLQDIFVATPPREDDAYTGSHRLISPLRPTGLKPHFLEKLAANNVVLPPTLFSGEDPDTVRASFTASGFGGAHE